MPRHNDGLCHSDCGYIYDKVYFKMIDYEQLMDDIQDAIHKIGRRISYGIRSTDFQQGCLVGEAIAYGKILEDLRERVLKEDNHD